MLYRYQFQLRNKCIWHRYFSSVAIIGGGTSGLSALKELKSDGYDVKLFEQSSDIGGQWNTDNSYSNIWSEMYSNSQVDVCSYSDFPHIFYSNRNMSHFGTAKQVQEHMKAYAKYFNLYEHIQFNTTIQKAIPFDETCSNSDKWTVYYDQKQEIFDKIVICNGCFNKPIIPQNLRHILSNKEYKGKIYNTQQINDINFKNQRVLIIGGGITGSELAELSMKKNAKKVYLNYRNKFFYIPLFWRDPTDTEKWMKLDDIFSARVPSSGFDVATLFREDQSLEKYGFYCPEKTFENEIPRFCYYEDGMEYIQNGTYRGIYGALKDVENGNTLVFEDLNDKENIIKAKDVDIIIFATGWDFSASNIVLPSSIYDKIYDPSVNTKRRLLYLNTFIPGYKQNNLAFVGGNTVLVHHVFELQARLISSLWCNRCTIPDTDSQIQWVNDFYGNEDLIPWFPGIGPLPLVDEIADTIGALPDETDYPSKDIYDKVQNERLFGTQYRIKGYGKNPLALSTLLAQMNVERRDQNKRHLRNEKELVK